MQESWAVCFAFPLPSLGFRGARVPPRARLRSITLAASLRRLAVTFHLDLIGRYAPNGGPSEHVVDSELFDDTVLQAVACASVLVANDVDSPRTVEYSPVANVCV